MCNTEKVGAVSSSRMAASIPVYPEPRRVYPELRRAPIFSRLVFDRSRAISLSTNHPKSNRQTREVERLTTRRKQAPVTCSNRKNSHFCSDENQPFRAFLTGLPRAFLAKGSICKSTFLTGSGSQTECDVTYSKQTPGEFLTGARTAFETSCPARHIERNIDSLLGLAQDGARIE